MRFDKRKKVFPPGEILEWAYRGGKVWTGEDWFLEVLIALLKIGKSIDTRVHFY